MKSLIILVAIGLLMGLPACSSISVSTDYDSDANFATYKTFDWLPHRQKAPARNPFVDKRIRSAVDRELSARGYRQTANGTDFLIAYHVGSKEKLDVTTYGYRYGRRGRFWGRGVRVEQYTQGTLVLDFVDSKSNELVWRGIATSVIRDRDPEESEGRINDAVKAILEEFPPK